MIEILSRPGAFNGQRVIVDGVFAFGISDSAIYVNTESYENMMTKNALTVRIQVRSSEINKLIALSGKYVSIDGVVDATDCGHLCAFSGSLHDIRAIHALTGRAEEIKK